MRFLADAEIFEAREDGSFAATDFSEYLHLVDCIASGDEGWALWTALPEALETGKPNFQSVHGLPFFEYASQHPDRNANWKDWNTITAAPWLREAARVLELQGSETVIDVGGGQGNFLAEVLRAHPACQGILYDLPEVVDTAPEFLGSKGVLDRCTIVPGNAFERVPEGGDIYIFSRVIFNWDDERAAIMLRNAAGAMRPESRLFVVESLLRERSDPRRSFQSGNDIHLFLVFGSCHRTWREMQELLERSGLVFAEVRHARQPGQPTWDVIEARRRQPG
jgi:hypothetical protein